MLSIILSLTALLAGLFAVKLWGVIEGTLGPLTSDTGSSPVEGTNEVQTVTIGGTPDGGSFKLSLAGLVSTAIAWSATTGTLLANVRNALMGIASVQTITFAGTITGGTFRLRYKGQETDTITWSATNNTLRDRVDSALEALTNIGTAGVATAVGTMTSGIGTLTVTFAKRGAQPVLEVSDMRLTGTGAAVSVANTTPGVTGPIGDSGVTVADSTLSSGVGDLTVTFDGDDYGKKVQPTMVVAANDLTGTAPTVEVAETTAGVDAIGRGLLPGGVIIDTSDGTHYVNEGEAQAPDYKAVTTS